MDYTTVDALSKLGRFSVVIIAALVILQTLGFSISGVLAFGGIGGIAMGFAAKDMLANFFGGLTIYLDRPFTVGEWIRSPDKAIEGTVEYIGWRHTRVRAFNKNPIYVPNALFTTIGWRCHPHDQPAHQGDHRHPLCRPRQVGRHRR